MSHYNVKSTETSGTYLFTKFDDDLNIVDDSVYLTSLEECSCPAGSRATCRHRQMLPMFLTTDRADTGFFYCFETSSWSEPFEALDDGADLTGSPDSVDALSMTFATTAGPDEASPALHDSEPSLMLHERVLTSSEVVKEFGTAPAPKTFRRL